MNFRALEKSIRVLEKSWKSPENLFLKKVTNPVLIDRKNLLKGVTDLVYIKLFFSKQHINSWY